MTRALLAFALMWMPSLAAASGGGDTSGSDQTQTYVVSIIMLVGASYLLAHFVVDWLQRRFLFSSGVEYIVIGLGLGYLSVFSDLTPMAPIIALAAGWVGLVYGMELDLRKILRINDKAVRVALFEGLGSGVLVAIGAHQFLMSGLGGEITQDQAWMAAGVMGCASAAGSSSAIDLVARRYDIDTPTVGLLRRTASLGDLISIIVFGVLFCVFHNGQPVNTVRPPNASDWFLMTVGTGLALGIFLRVFLGEDESDNSRFLAMVGVIAFASGAAFFLDLSLLTVNLVLGMVVANSAQDGEGVAATLTRTGRPMSLILLVFAGALWDPPWATSGATLDVVREAAPALLFALSYILLRVGGKLLGCWCATIGTDIRGDIARGLLAQGDEALAMAIGYKLVYDGPAVDIAYTAILASVVVHELFAPRILKGLLIDAGDIRHESVVGG